MISFFTAVDGRLVPEPLAISPWSAKTLSGTGVCGLLARELEGHCPDGFVPARFTADLYQPVANAEFSLRSTVIRRGSRIAVVDTSLLQDGRERVRATAVFLARGEQPPGELWTAADELPMPPAGATSPDGSAPLFKSGDRDWTGDFAGNQNADRKFTWQSLPPLVAGEPITAFQRAAVAGDAASLVCHWGSAGAGYINADVTVALSRLPHGHEIGLRADSTVTASGISVGTATLYDRIGPVGTCVVTALSNARRQIDLGSTTPAEMAGEPR